MWRGKKAVQKILEAAAPNLTDEGKVALEKEAEVIMTDYERMCQAFADIHDIVRVEVTETGILLCPDEGKVNDRQLARDIQWAREQCKERKVGIRIKNDNVNNIEYDGGSSDV